MRLLALAAVLVPTAAVAEPGPRFAVGFEYAGGDGGHVEDLDLGLRFEPGLFFRLGRWQATVSVPVNPKIHSNRPERDGDELTGVGLSGRLAYRLRVGSAVFSFGGGVTRRWVSSDQPVMRTCAQTGDCIAGWYFEKPHYHAWAPQLRIGVGPEKLTSSLVLGMSIEIVIEAISLTDVPPDGLRDVSVLGVGTFAIGGGPSR